MVLILQRFYFIQTNTGLSYSQTRSLYWGMNFGDNDFNPLWLNIPPTSRSMDSKTIPLLTLSVFYSKALFGPERLDPLNKKTDSHNHSPKHVKENLLVTIWERGVHLHAKKSSLWLSNKSTEIKIQGTGPWPWNTSSNFSHSNLDAVYACKGLNNEEIPTPEDRWW